MAAASGKFEIVPLIAGSIWANVMCSPFVQRVWIALEAKGIPYQYIEVDPYKKPETLLEVNPRGLVPAIRHGNWGCYESTVLLEYVCSSSPFLFNKRKIFLFISASWSMLISLLLA